MVLLQNTWPTTQALFKATGEELGKRFEVDLGGNRIADLLALPNRVNVYVRSDENPAAMLRFGSSYSGSLWLRGHLVGEFMMEPAGSFQVVEIENGFKRPTPLDDTDPIYYLLQRLQGD